MKKHPASQGRWLILRRIALVMSVLLFLLSAGMLLHRMVQTRQTQTSLDELRKVKNMVTDTAVDTAVSADPGSEEAASVSSGLSTLKAMNDDFVGWLAIEGTHIDYPVMQSSADDPEYYLYRSFEQTYDANGLPFLDARCSLNPSSDLLLIYGHNMRSGMMFHELLQYRDVAFWAEHRSVRLETPTGQQVYEVAATFLYDASSGSAAFKPHQVVEFANKDTFYEYVSRVMDASLYNTGISIEYGDKLLLLISCDRSQAGDGRLIVLAKQIADISE